MDPTQTKALAALEPYILLSKSALSPRAAADLITRATSAPNTYIFAELLQTPAIRALRTAPAEHARHLTLLETFAWGTWADYHCKPPSPPLPPPNTLHPTTSPPPLTLLPTANPTLPTLPPPQSLKLRHLTLLTLATSHAFLTYAHLQTALSLPTPRALEDVVIRAIYAGLLSATLDPRAARVDVVSVAPLRDVRPGGVCGMLEVLEGWEKRCVGVLGELEGEVRQVRRRAGERRGKGAGWEGVVGRAMVEGEKGRGLGKRGAGDGDGVGEEGGEGEGVMGC